MTFGLGWIRRRQRSLTRGVLALVCAAWLQAAVVPCVTAHDGGSAPASASHEQHAVHAAHDHASHASPVDEARPGQPCLYCPPGAPDAEDCGEHGCAYPHGAQVDARAGAIFVALPVSVAVPLEGKPVASDRPLPSAHGCVPRINLSVSYCRFIE